MDDNEVDRVAARLVQKMMELPFPDALAEAIAKELRHLVQEYSSEMKKLGERLDSGRFYTSCRSGRHSRASGWVIAEDPPCA